MQQNKAIEERIKTVIGNKPPQFNFVRSMLFEINPAEYTKVAKENYAMAKSVFERIGNDKKLLALTDQKSKLNFEYTMMNKAFNEKDWVKINTYATEVITDGYYVLPFSLSNSREDILYKEAEGDFETVKFKLNDLERKIKTLENKDKISFYDWLNLSYVEDDIEGSETNLFKQIDQSFTGYKDLQKAHNSSDVFIQKARHLGTIFSVIEMVRNRIDMDDIVVSSISTRGDKSLSLLEKQHIITKYADMAQNALNNVKPEEKSWGKRMCIFSKGLISEAGDMEKKQFYSLALYDYQSALCFAKSAQDWVTFRDHLHYPDLKNMKAIPVDTVLSSYKESIKGFDVIKAKLKANEDRGIYCLNIGPMVNNYYYSWFGVGDTFLRRYVKTKNHWITLGNFAYMNIGPVPHMLAITQQIMDDLYHITNTREAEN